MHVEAVLNSVRCKGFQLQRDEYQFGRTEALFLSFNVNGSSISITYETTDTIAEWPEPATPRRMRSCVGLAGVCHHFIKNCTKVSTPLMGLLHITPAELNTVQ
jgi:hypothetical protein